MSFIFFKNQDNDFFSYLIFWNIAQSKVSQQQLSKLNFKFCQKTGMEFFWIK